MIKLHWLNGLTTRRPRRTDQRSALGGRPWFPARRHCGYPYCSL